MHAMNKISAFIMLLKPANKVLRSIISAANIVEEIVIVLSNKIEQDWIDINITDKICPLIRQKIIYKQFIPNCNLQVFIQQNCRHKWILNLKPDEELSFELQEEINYIFQSGLADKYASYNIRVVSILPTKKPKPLAPSSRAIKLYNSAYSKLKSNTIGLLQKTQDTNLELINPVYKIINTSRASLSQRLNEHLLNSKNTKIKIINILIWIFCFIRLYFARRYFILGVAGFRYAVVSGISTLSVPNQNKIDKIIYN